MCVFVDVAKNRLRPRGDHSKVSRDERVRGQNDFVSRLQAKSHQRQLEGVESGPDAHAILRAQQARELDFESLDFRAQDVPLTLHHPLDRSLDLGPQLPVVALEVDERDAELTAIGELIHRESQAFLELPVPRQRRGRRKSG